MTQLWRALEPLWQWNATSSWLLAALLLLVFLRIFAAFLRRWWKVEDLVEAHGRLHDKHDELQEGCLSKLRWEKILDPETNRKVDDLAYQKGTHRDIILAVLALEARDLLLPQYGWGEGEAGAGREPVGEA